ncbi:hypothetical protein R1flu_008891 [Riccia fluitans]|uniref:Uncharacterized protein n=1 Tax=Riccia fluitans TaxID=41844 RepID=A0ABD1Z1Q1_9MARC
MEGARFRMTNQPATLPCTATCGKTCAILWLAELHLTRPEANCLQTGCSQVNMDAAIVSRGDFLTSLEKGFLPGGNLASNARTTVTMRDFPAVGGKRGRLQVQCQAERPNSQKRFAQATDVQLEVNTTSNSSWENHTKVFEYESAANPLLKGIPVLGLNASDHRYGPSRVSTLDLSEKMDIIGYPASSPNLLASFVRICVGESLTTSATATSQAFYVIHGQGKTHTEFGDVEWKTGDLFVIPGTNTETKCTHVCYNDDKENTGGAGLYWVHDSPLLSYLGVVPTSPRFQPAFYSWELLMANMEKVRLEDGADKRNRMGILLGNSATPQTKTLSHTLWSLLNVLDGGQMQKPHRHSSTALDLAIYAPPGAYTLMGQTLDQGGNIIDPLRVDWQTGAMFVTPPGWWHSHHNESNEEAWVLPMQDAGLYTYQRTLDIRFSDEQVEMMKKNILR